LVSQKILLIYVDRALVGRLLLCQVGLRRRSRAALAGRAGLPGWGCFIPSTSRWATTPWPGRKLGDDGGGLVTGLQPGHGAVGRCQEAPISLSRGLGWCLRLVLMVKDCSGRINPAARAFGVSGLTRPLQSLRRPGRRGRGQADQGLVELAGDVALQAADDLASAEALGGASGHVAVGPFVQAQPGQHDGVPGRCSRRDHRCGLAGAGGSCRCWPGSAPPRTDARTRPGERIRCGLSPTVVNSCPTTSTPTPSRSVIPGAAVATRPCSSTSASLISVVRCWWRRASRRNATFTAWAGFDSGPDVRSRPHACTRAEASQDGTGFIRKRYRHRRGQARSDNRGRPCVTARHLRLERLHSWRNKAIHQLIRRKICRSIPWENPHSGAPQEKRAPQQGRELALLRGLGRVSRRGLGQGRVQVQVLEGVQVRALAGE
jgi:hypothetical protein